MSEALQGIFIFAGRKFAFIWPVFDFTSCMAVQLCAGLETLKFTRGFRANPGIFYPGSDAFLGSIPGKYSRC